MRLKKKRKVKKLTPQEKEQRQQIQDIRRLLINIGFIRITGVAGKEFVFKGRTAEIDDVFHFENVIVIVEYTTVTKTGDHLLKKKLIYDKINDSPKDFIQFLAQDAKFQDFSEYLKQSILCKYSLNHLRIVILHCSKNPISHEHKSQLEKVCFFDYPIMKYFQYISRVIKKTSRFEFFKFINVANTEIGGNILQSTTISTETFSGHILPEEHSNYSEGYKIVSFYIDADSLLQRAYVLRRDGWNSSDSIGLYQRMFIPQKINSMRKYLSTSGRVFINNLITVLPVDKIKLYDENKQKIEIDDKGNFVNITSGTKVQLTEIEITNETNIIGIIDGQHRLYAYHEGNDKHEPIITNLRKIQNLLVTGVLYPKNENKLERLKFEAGLFLEINDNQTTASSDLKQAIELMIHPFSLTAIAKSILNKLNQSGPLENLFEDHFYDKGLKTASIISYGLKPLVKFEGNDTLYKNWQEPEKERLKDENNSELLDSYISYCASEIRKIFVGFKDNVHNKAWTAESLDPNGILRVTAINGVINCLRLLIENDIYLDIEDYQDKLNGIEGFNFKEYKSSQYRKLGQAIYTQYFA